MTLTHGSLFSGVGGMDLGFDAAGIETLWQCEIDAKPRSVLAKHWPNATRYIDVKDVDGSKVKPVDIITFGSPCQDLSIAGKRAGLAGSRSSLYHQAIRVIKEMRDATQNQYPRVAIWENVRGAFSSNDGADFHEALQALADIGAVDISWRLVNACNFGVPQRRVRVFVVASFGEERAGEVLAEPTRLLWHPPQGGEEGQETTGEVEDSAGSGGWATSRRIAQAMTAHDGGPDLKHADAGHLTYKMSKPSENLDFDHGVSPTITSKWHKGNAGPSGDEVQNLVTYVKIIRSGARNADGDLPPEVWAERSVSPTLNVFDNTGEVRATVIIPDKSYKVRRLTPRECERLMGWPDDHTRYDDKGNELADSARYKMCGNGIASPVAQWIGENIVEAYGA